MASPSILSFFQRKTGSDKENEKRARTEDENETQSPPHKRGRTIAVACEEHGNHVDSSAKQPEPVESADSRWQRPAKPDSKKLYEQNKRVRRFQESWKLQFPWVVHVKQPDHMYCAWCKEYPKISDQTAAIVTGSTNYRIETMRNHDGSAKHLLCKARVKAAEQPEQIPLKVAIRKYTTKVDDQTQGRLAKLVNTAFYVTKENLSFAKFKGLCALQNKNGADMGTMYQHDKACRDFVRSIAEVDREDNVSKVSDSRFLCILADGSTDSSQTEQEAIFLRYVTSDGEPKTVLCDIIPVADAHAQGVKSAIDKGLLRLEIDEESLKKKLVAVNFDGAAVMMGRKSGVATLYKELCPWIITIHCVAHNLELAVLDVLKDLKCVKHVEETVKAIFKWYYYSPKRKREVNRIADVLEESHVYFSGVQQVRWLASRYRAFSALQRHLPTTVIHLEAAAALPGEDGAKAKGFLTKLTGRDFVESLYFLLDVMKVLSDISVTFQQDGLFITDVVRNLEKGMLHLVNLQTTPGDNYRAFQSNFNEDTHILTCGKSTVPLKQNKATKSVLADELKSALDKAVTYMDKRFSALQSPPVSLFDIFDPSQWPVDKGILLRYGDEEIANLIDHFQPVLTEQEVACIPSEWVDLKLKVTRRRAENPCDIYKSLLASTPKCLQNVLSLVKVMITISPSTATVERCFSSMNLIKTNLKTKMKEDTLSDLLRVNLMEEDTTSYDPTPAVRHFLTSGVGKRHTRGHNVTTRDVSQENSDDSVIRVE